MRSTIFKGAVVFFATLSATLIGFAAQGGTEQPRAAANKGKEVFEGACGTCHGLETATEGRYAADGWASVVDRMMQRGAEVKTEDVAPLINFLTATYGVKEATPTAQSAPEQPKAAENKGKAIFEGACGNCHGLDTATEARYAEDGWTSVVDRMMQRGAEVKTEDVAPLINFLTATYGVKEATPTAQSAPEPPKAAENKGKAIFEGACGNCHGLDTATEARYAEDGWTSVVDRMMQRGAEVKTEDVAPLINFLTATYGVKEATPTAQ